ncbi:2-oxoglutarate and iron-dependent oxygenase JMJD4 [Ixodes scapularis]
MRCLQPDFAFAFRTPFHADVFGSYSWSANVCGRKLWHLFPPGNEDALRDSEGKLPYDVTLPECARGDTDKKLGITVTQEAGEVIFVPSGWHHQVHNLVSQLSLELFCLRRTTRYNLFYPAIRRWRIIRAFPAHPALAAEISRDSPQGRVTVTRL